VDCTALLNVYVTALNFVVIVLLFWDSIPITYYPTGKVHTTQGCHGYFKLRTVTLYMMRLPMYIMGPFLNMHSSCIHRTTPNNIITYTVLCVSYASWCNDTYFLDVYHAMLLPFYVMLYFLYTLIYCLHIFF
jgi:hypothetical protein